MKCLCYLPVTTGYEVAWMDTGDFNLNDSDVRLSIRDQVESNLRELTVSELEREVGDTEQIALWCEDELPAGLSDKLLKSVRCLRLSELSEHDWTE